MNSVSENASKRDYRFDNLKGLLIILVVVGHFLLPLAETRFVTSTIHTIYFFHMPAFVLISGYFAKGIVKNGEIQWKKILRVLVLFIVFKLIVYIPEGLVAGHFSRGTELLHESGAPWYLWALFIWYLTVPLLDKLHDKKIIVIVISCVFAVVIFGRYLVDAGDLLSLDRVIGFYPFFVAGYYIDKSMIEDFSKSKAKLWTGITTIILLVILFIGFKEFFYDYRLVEYGVQYSRYSSDVYGYAWLINIIWFAGSIFVSIGLFSFMKNQKIPILTVLGQNTLPVYIIHRPIRDLCQYFGLNNLIDSNSKVQVIILIILSALLAVLIGLAAEWYNRVRP